MRPGGVMSPGDASGLAAEARGEAMRLLEKADTETMEYQPRTIATAQVWATLSVSYELAARS